MCALRVLAELAQGTALAEEVPGTVEIDLQRRQSRVRFAGHLAGCRSVTKISFFLHELLYLLQDLCVIHFDHTSRHSREKREESGGHPQSPSMGLPPPSPSLDTSRLTGGHLQSPGMGLPPLSPSLDTSRLTGGHHQTPGTGLPPPSFSLNDEQPGHSPREKMGWGTAPRPQCGA